MWLRRGWVAQGILDLEFLMWYFCTSGHVVVPPWSSFLYTRASMLRVRTNRKEKGSCCEEKIDAKTTRSCKLLQSNTKGHVKTEENLSCDVWALFSLNAGGHERQQLHNKEGMRTELRRAGSKKLFLHAFYELYRNSWKRFSLHFLVLTICIKEKSLSGFGE